MNVAWAYETLMQMFNYGKKFAPWHAATLSGGISLKT